MAGNLVSVPYGFDCYAFEPNEIKYYNQYSKEKGDHDYYLRFTRKTETYTQEQKDMLVVAGRINQEELDAGKQLFCGIKVQLGITVVTNFLNLGVQYKKPNPGKSDFINGTWNGIVSGLTNPILANSSYDIAFGNFLAYDQEVPFLKFGPFFEIESKLVLLTGNSRKKVESSFATNVDTKVWLAISLFVILLSILASCHAATVGSFCRQFWHYIFICITMLLNKPSEEFEILVFGRGHNQPDRMIATSARISSYLWSAACLIMATSYSGELLAVILLSTDKSIDTISELLQTNPPIQPFIRQDDFTYKLMLDSQDTNMIALYNRTKIIPRSQVYSKRFIEAIANRRYALLGDDEIIETIDDTYNRYFDLHVSKTNYLQFPISIMYRKEIPGAMEYKLRRGITQLFETGIIQRWYDAQKEFYTNSYDNQTKSIIDDSYSQGIKSDYKFVMSMWKINLNLNKSKMLPLHGVVKNYHWGKIGQDSTIAKFEKLSSSKLSQSGVVSSINEDIPLAELWLGTHPSGPSTVEACGHSIGLADFIKTQPEMCGSVDHIVKYGSNLPFLFKILSVGQALSLQAHPDKRLAVILHHQDPKNYPDPNHKPEMAIALTDFEVLCDFRCHEQILKFMKELDPLRKVVTQKSYDFYSEQKSDEMRQQGLAKCFTALVSCEKSMVAKELKNLIANNISSLDTDLANVLIRLQNLYPQDPGCFAVFFLNYIKLAPGQGIFLEANKLHAYLSGECIECMACSDNVVRAGLTSKFCDVQTLTSMLDYKPKKIGDIILKPSKSNKNLTLYKPPIEEFAVDKIEAYMEDADYTIPPVHSGSIMIVIGGSAEAESFLEPRNKFKISLGTTAFIPPQVSLKLTNIAGTFTAFRAYC